MQLQLRPADLPRTVRSRRGRYAYRQVSIPTNATSMEYNPLPRSVVEVLEGDKVVADLDLGLNIPQVLKLKWKDSPEKVVGVTTVSQVGQKASAIVVRKKPWERPEPPKPTPRPAPVPQLVPEPETPERVQTTIMPEPEKLVLAPPPPEPEETTGPQILLPDS